MNIIDTSAVSRRTSTLAAAVKLVGCSNRFPFGASGRDTPDGLREPALTLGAAPPTCGRGFATLPPSLWRRGHPARLLSFFGHPALASAYVAGAS